MDYIWSEYSANKETGKTNEPTDRKARVKMSLPSSGDGYGLLPCMAHALYAPLYIAGPIITYNDFMWQIYGDAAPKPEPLVPWKSTMRYAVRLFLDVLVIELVTHFLYFNSVAIYKTGLRLKDHGLKYGAVEVALTAWWVLAFMWLKFAVIWRFFRFAALAEGIDPPENMVRCFAMNYDIQGFWKSWHASFNQWIVRYIYIPAGGSKYQMIMIWPIFFFVAVWHDLDWRLFGWAGLMCFAFLPEILIKQEVRSSRWNSIRQSWCFDFMCGIFAAMNIGALMSANMAGFVVGVDGLTPLLREMLQSPLLLAVSFSSFYCAARLMFAYRTLLETGKNTK